MPGGLADACADAINTESVIGYNNQLKQAVPGMKLGVNDEVNTSAKKVGVTHMEGRPPKIDRPINRPSNKAPGVPAQPDKTAPVQSAPVQATKPTAHKTNKILLITGLGLGAFAFSRYVL